MLESMGVKRTDVREHMLELEEAARKALQEAIEKRLKE